MRRFRNSGFTPWGASLSLLGLLVTAAIMIYLVGLWTDSLTLRGPEQQEMQELEKSTTDPQPASTAPAERPGGILAPIQRARDIQNLADERTRRLEDIQKDQ